MDQRIAAIDIGSNSVRQIIADVSPAGQIRVVDELKATPRLGEGIERTGLLQDAPMDAATASVQRMVQLAQQLGATRTEIVATSAVRDARNAATFTERVERETGIPVRVLSGDEEAYLCFRSALAHFELGVGRSLVMDIGGGSLELVLAKDGVVDRMASLPFGAVRMTERFLTPVSPRGVRALREHVKRKLRRGVPARDWRGTRVIGSGGTFTNLASMVLARQKVSAHSPHGTTVSRVELEHVLELLQRLSPAERQQVPGLNPERADIIVAGLAVAAEVMTRFESRELMASSYGIREGLLLEAAEVEPVISDPGAARQRSVREFALRCHYEEAHALQVQRLSLQLFDALASHLGLGDVDRGILADAALLHDTGYLINYDRHHKHSFHLISHADLLGMTPVEQLAIAHVARYHRGASPKRKHAEFAQLDRSLRERITALAAILRVADGFDRGHVSAVDSIEVRWSDDALQLQASMSPTANSVRLECWGASRKRDLLESVVERRVEILDPDGSLVVTSDDDGEAE